MEEGLISVRCFNNRVFFKYSVQLDDFWQFRMVVLGNGDTAYRIDAFFNVFYCRD